MARVNVSATINMRLREFFDEGRLASWCIRDVWHEPDRVRLFRRRGKRPFLGVIGGREAVEIARLDWRGHDTGCGWNLRVMGRDNMEMMTALAERISEEFSQVLVNVILVAEDEVRFYPYD